MRTDRPDRAPTGPRASAGGRAQHAGHRPSAEPSRSARPYARDEPPTWQQQARRADRAVAIPADITADELDPQVRRGLRALNGNTADLVARHLVAAGVLVDDDPALALQHAKAARALAGRLGIVREAVGITAYHAGEYAEALAELRAARRLTGSDEHLPVMADAERGLGRPERALTLVLDSADAQLDGAGRAELAIVGSGARRDMGEPRAAVLALRAAGAEDPTVKPWSARLRYAYAAALVEAGDRGAAREWFEAALAVDADDETDAAERLNELTGGHD